MAKSKRPKRVAAHRAAKILQNPKSTKSTKSSAAKTLANLAVNKRTVKSAPKSGNVKRAAIKKAVATVKLKKAS